MVSTDNAVPSTTFHGHPVFTVLAYVVLGVALLIGILHEITFALEVLRMLVARVKTHLRALAAAARALWVELTTWNPPAPPSDAHRPDDGAG